jgi:hypothetical protein
MLADSFDLARVINKRRMIDDPSLAVFDVRDARKNMLRGLQLRVLLGLLPMFFRFWRFCPLD